MESRVAVLEQIARSTNAMLERSERRIDQMDQRIELMRAEFRVGFDSQRTAMGTSACAPR